MGMEYMTLFMRDEEMRAEGRVEGKLATYRELLQDGVISKTEVAKRLQISENDVELFLESNGDKR